MWFGHGTKPKSAAPIAPLAERIHNAGHALVAGLPASQRTKPGFRLAPADHARLNRLLRAVSDGRHAAADVLGVHPEAPGIGAFVDAAHKLRNASTQSDLRDATDKLAESAGAMGPDRFKPFLRNADDHLSRQVADRPADPPSSPPEPAAPPANPAPAPEPEHGKLWHWLHNLGLVNTKHETADILRRGMGSQSGLVYLRDGVPLDVDNMSDDEVIALNRETRNDSPTPWPLGTTESFKTQWGWNDSPAYKDAVKQLRIPGTHETVNGKVPTQREAEDLIKEAKGIVLRIEEGHGPNSVSPHNQPHINYAVPGIRGRFTVYIQRIE